MTRVRVTPIDKDRQIVDSNIDAHSTCSTPKETRQYGRKRLWSLEQPLNKPIGISQRRHVGPRPPVQFTVTYDTFKMWDGLFTLLFLCLVMGGA